MIFLHKKHLVPGLNTTSTADISFMLLTFFLVTSSMDVDKGLSRQLPPAEKKEQQPSEMNKNLLLKIVITANNEITIDEKQVRPEVLSGRIEHFVSHTGKKHMVNVDCSPEANYNTYFQVENAIVVAYNNIRNKYSQEHFHKNYADLLPDEKDQVKDACPQRVSETYNTAIKGGQQ